MTNDEIEKSLECALDMLYQEDKHLLEVECHEISIAHRIAVYMESYFDGWNIDLEYNRDKDAIKRRKDDREFRPDIVMHRRGTDENLVAIEIKTEWNSDDYDGDIERLEELTTGKFDYKVGIFLLIRKKREDVELRSFGTGCK
ncbi:MAG: hypothetical protein ACYS1A_16030 [Planctomycetota bacterium]|jgi:hypothetical protein